MDHSIKLFGSRTDSNLRITLVLVADFCIISIKTYTICIKTDFQSPKVVLHFRRGSLSSTTFHVYIFQFLEYLTKYFIYIYKECASMEFDRA